MPVPLLFLSAYLFGDYGVGQGAQSFDSDGDGFAGTEPALGGAAKAYAGRCACGDDVAGKEGCDGGEVFDEVGDFEDELTGVGVLQGFAVDGEGDLEVVGVGDFVGGDDGRAEGAEGWKRLRHRPLGRGELNVAGGDVVDDGIAVDVVAPGGGGDAIAAAANDEGELGFVVGLGGVAGEDYGVAGATDGGGEFEEDDRGGGELHAGLRGVIAVVKSDGEDAGRVGNRGVEAYRIQRKRGAVGGDGQAGSNYAEGVTPGVAEGKNGVVGEQGAGADVVVVGGVGDEFHECPQRRWRI
jgi:hypothetical protein